MGMRTDFHSHILPGIDDGSSSVEESIGMLRLESRHGIARVIATPHFYPRHDDPHRFLARRDRAEEQLRRAMAEEAGMPEVSVGAEVYFFRGISESELLPQLTIRGNNCILLEMPPAPWPEELLWEVESIWEKRGIIPIIAHIDRYITPLRTFGLPERLADMPVYVQANGSFFLNRITSPLAMKLLKGNQIQLLGSDCHDLTSRKPNLDAAAERIRRKLGQEALDRIGTYEFELLDAHNAGPLNKGVE